MRVLLDTNILLRSAQPNHPLSAQATQAVAKLIRRNDEVFFCPQNIAEFWNVATRPSDKNGLGFSSDEARREVANIEESLSAAGDSIGVRNLEANRNYSPGERCSSP